MWLDYADFAGNDCCLIEKTQDIYDRALQTLPVTQHRKIWEAYAKWALGLGRVDDEDELMEDLLRKERNIVDAD